MLDENRTATTKCATHRCCSTQDTRVPPEHRRFRRIHGLQLPLHPQQVTGWVLLVVVCAGTFTVLTTPPLLPPPLSLLPPSDLRLVLSIAFAALFLAHALAHLTVLLLDPADPEVRARPAGEIVPEFDRTKHRHVIENGRCHLCNITTRGRRTKHCSICNKCVPRFDHHCKWLNNCIGGRNYPAFLACLLSTLVIALAVTGLALSELVLVNARVVTWTDTSNNGTMNNATASSSLPIPGAGSLVLVTVIGVLSAIAAVLLIHLCFFHGYIACLGLTTYEYVRSKREKVSGIAVATGTSRSTASSVSCGVPRCGTDSEDVDLAGGRSLYRFCENGPLFRDDTTATMTTGTTDVYVCSTHEEHGDDVANGKDARSSRLSSMRSSRNFRLCFSYDSRTTETSIEVSSRTTAVENHGESPKSSTPSPVSCCFSIMNPDGGRHERSMNRKRRAGEHPDTAKRSCGTMKRIQTFLQTRLRKGSSRQRSVSSLATTVARSCGNKVTPANSPLEIAPVNEDRLVEAIPTTEQTPLPDPRPPVRLPALDLPPHAIQKIRTPPNSGDISVLGPMPAVMSKRNQIHLRTRRNTFSRKRPRFKVGPHVVTQTAQLSPIPESEFSKPATPRSPSRSGHFAFPPLRE